MDTCAVVREIMQGKRINIPAETHTIAGKEERVDKEEIGNKM